MRNPYIEGRNAEYRGWTEKACPYPANTDDAEAWRDGWQEERENRLAANA